MTEHLHRATNQSYYQLLSGFARVYWSLPGHRPSIPGSARHSSSADRRSGLSMDGAIITEIRVCILLVSWSWAGAELELCNDECLGRRMIYHSSWLTGLLSPSSPPSYNFQHFSSNKKQNPLWVKDLWRCSIESQSFQAVVSCDYEEKNMKYFLSSKTWTITTIPLMYSGVKQRKWFWLDFPFWFSSDDWTWCIGKLIIENISVR